MGGIMQKIDKNLMKHQNIPKKRKSPVFYGWLLLLLCLGNITVGDNSYVGANAVVIKDVPPNSTAVGIPARLTRQDGKKIEEKLDHIHTLDPVFQRIEELKDRLDNLENKR